MGPDDEEGMEVQNSLHKQAGETPFVARRSPRTLSTRHSQIPQLLRESNFLSSYVKY